MTFISYAQNFEDIMLWRALKHVGKGFYIDVGANDPVVDSVTLAFYERGWRGINVEPMQQYYERLCIKRPADINLPHAVGDAEGELTFHDVPDTGLSTVDSALAELHAAAGHAVSRHRVRVMTLSEICSAHVQGPIHFLKIDVEGFEKSVLRGMDFTRWRPWILVVEATRPQSQITSHEEWENLVLDAAYRFAYFDGLNHYYVADEHQDLSNAFKAPPNFFDHFQLREDHAFSYPLATLKTKVQQAEARARDAEAVIQQTQAQLQQAETRILETETRILEAQTQAQLANTHLQQTQAQAQQQLRDAHAQLQQAHQQIAVIFASTSWRVTRPMRQLMTAIRNPKTVLIKLRGLINRVTALVRRLVLRILKWLIAQQRFRILAIRILARFPAMEETARRMAIRIAAPSSPAMPAPAEVPSVAKELPAPARKVFADIQRNINRSQ